MNWSVDLSVEVVPCPQERLVALRAAWATIYRLAANETPVPVKEAAGVYAEDIRKGD